MEFISFDLQVLTEIVGIAFCCIQGAVLTGIVQLDVKQDNRIFGVLFNTFIKRNGLSRNVNESTET